MKRLLITSVVAGALLAAPVFAQPPDWNQPPEAPAGYGDYYHDQTATPDLPSRWGYRRGFDDGISDKAKGHSFRPSQGDHFKDVPEINNTGMKRQEIKNRFRDAYIHGYERGYGQHS